MPTIHPFTEGKIPNHTYSAAIIFLLLQFIINASVSFRGSERVLSLVNDALGNPLPKVPSWYSVRSWFLRMGHYKLTRPKTIADDWAWIIDHTIKLGKTKCLLILGIRLSELPEGKVLHHQDLEPIDLVPVETSNGEIVWQQLEEAKSKTGIPRIIVSDYGSDLKTGIQQFCNAHPSCAHVYDIKHKTACLLKADLEKDEAWLAFKKLAGLTRNQLQQTALAHLRAPNQRSKARYMNIGILLEWGQNTLQVITEKTDFSDAEKQQLPKLEWLRDYEDTMKAWDESLQVMKLSEQWVRQEGITSEGYSKMEKQFQEKLPELNYEKAISLRKTLLDFVKIQAKGCQPNEAWLGTSEAIESMFGKQKYIDRNYVKEGFTSLILGIGSLVGSMTIETVKEALNSTSVKDVTQWCNDKLGKTVMSKKIATYSGKSTTMD